MISLTRSQVREIDRRATEEFGVPSIVLMENAGRGAAEIFMRLNADKWPVLIVCGKGNNGGDGLVIARHLDNHGWPVAVHLTGNSSEFRGDAATNWEIVRRSGIAIFDLPTSFDGWIIDALFGTGLTGAIRSPLDRIVSWINDSGARVLAVDIPSGLDCDAGEPLGPTVRADHTVTFVARKAGFENPLAKEWLGEVHVAHIGAPVKLIEQFRAVQGAGR
jgi:NAD(P)H-hydrate epimerase